jgi:hypothetical protein
MWLEMAGERTRPRVIFQASRRKTVFGGTPNTTCEDAYAPQKTRGVDAKSLITSAGARGAGANLHELGPTKI